MSVVDRAYRDLEATSSFVEIRSGWKVPVAVSLFARYVILVVLEL